MARYASVLADALSAGARAVPVARFRFDDEHPAAARWAEQRGAELVTAVTDDVRAAIRAVVAQGFEHGIAVPELAKSIRATVGLTERDARAVMNRQVKLLSGGAKSDEALESAERYAGQLQRKRSLLIARTETMRAANEGQKQLWQQAQQAGQLGRGARKAWITADACPRCRPLEGETVGIDEDFSVGQDPPLHPRCRCTVGLV